MPLEEAQIYSVTFILGLPNKKNVCRLRDVSETDQDPQLLRLCIEAVNSWVCFQTQRGLRSRRANVSLLFQENDFAAASGGTLPCLPGLQAFPEPSKLAPTLEQQHSPESTCIPCLLCLQGCLLNSSFVEKMSQGKMWNVQGGGVIMALWNHSYNFKMYIGSFISIVTLLI